MKAPILTEIENRRAIARIMNHTFAKHGMSQTVDETRLHVRPKFTAEFTENKNEISNAILDFMFPREITTATLDHFTSLDVLASIARENELRLYAVSKRIGEGEMKQFAEDHDFQGYLDEADGPAFYRELAKDLFYTSFTPPTRSDQTNLWEVFGGQGKGVRLRLRVKATGAELRPINYQAPQRRLLKEVNDQLHDASLPPFVPWTISKIGAFYLPSTLVFEDEVRLLVKRHMGGRNDARNDGTYEYWPLVLGQDDWFGRIDLVEIACGPHCQTDGAAASLGGTSFADVPIIPFT